MWLSNSRLVFHFNSKFYWIHFLYWFIRFKFVFLIIIYFWKFLIIFPYLIFHLGFDHILFLKYLFVIIELNVNFVTFIVVFITHSSSRFIHFIGSIRFCLLKIMGHFSVLDLLLCSFLTVKCIDLFSWLIFKLFKANFVIMQLSFIY